MSRNRLDTLVHQAYFKPNRSVFDGHVGIEVELEGQMSDWCSVKNWVVKPDNSLRNGLELVTEGPFTPGTKAWAELMGDFKKSLKDCKPMLSIRTSTHYHVNVSRYRIRQVYDIILAYYMLEELLIRQADKTRHGNLFCLRMKDANMLAFDLDRSITTKNYFARFSMENHKYGALNLAAVMKYGSLEFRFLEASWDVNHLTKWAECFDDLISHAGQIPAARMLDIYESEPAGDFVTRLIPSGSWLLQGLSRGEINDLIHTNYDDVRSLAKSLSRHDRFQMPPLLWSDDMDDEEWNQAVQTLQSKNSTHTPIYENDDPPPPPDVEQWAWEISPDVNPVDGF